MTNISTTLLLKLQLVLFLVYFPNCSPSTSPTRKQPHRHSNSESAFKGEAEFDDVIPIRPTTLTIISPPQPRHQIPKWETVNPQLTPGNVIINPNAVGSKGDGGVIDSRGTVRYNILPDGKIAKGIITTQADENSPYFQAQVIDSHQESYSPVEDDEEDET